MRQASADIKAFIKEEEGLKLTAYSDAGGYSIGYGHYLGTNIPQPYRNGITKEKAQSLFEADVRQAERAVTEEVNQPLNQNQFDALVSFTYNLGQDNLKTLAEYINEGRSTRFIQDKIKEYTKAKIDGEYKELAGLVDRRKAEAKRYGRQRGMATAEVSALAVAAVGTGFLLYKGVKQ
jgi:Phage-related lysozyme (muraminidase)